MKSFMLNMQTLLAVPWMILGKSLLSGFAWFFYWLGRGANLDACTGQEYKRVGWARYKMGACDDSWRAHVVLRGVANFDFSNVAGEKEKQLMAAGS